MCARQDIGLRGYREHEDSANKGNFLEILDVVASEDTTLKETHARCSQKKNKVNVMEIPNSVIPGGCADMQHLSCSRNAMGRFFKLWRLSLVTHMMVVNEPKPLAAFPFFYSCGWFDGITKLLSDTLQSKELDLARAVDLGDSVQKTLTEHRSQNYFDHKIWPNAVKDVMLKFTVQESNKEV